MFITKTELKLYLNGGMILSLFLLALLSFIAGLLGDKLLYGEKIFSDFILYVSDNDETVESKLLLEALKGFKSETMTVYSADEDVARRAVEDGEAAAALIIPRGFFADIMSGENSPASLYISGENETVSGIIRLFAISVKEQLSASQSGIYYILSRASDYDTYMKYMSESNMIFLSVFMGREIEEETVSPFGAVSNRDYYTFSFYVFVMFLMPCLFVDRGGRIKDSGILARLTATGLAISRIYIYKLLSLVAVYALLNALLMGTMVFVGIFQGIGFVGASVLFALFTLIQSLFCCLCIWSFDEVKAAGATVFVLGLSMLFFSGGILPLVFLPEAIRGFCRYTPNYYMTRLFLSMKTGEASYGDAVCILAFILLLLAASYLAACICERKCRAE